MRDVIWSGLDDGGSELSHEGRLWATLACGPALLARRSWPHGQPRAADIESAIDRVEEALERAGLRHAPRGTLGLDPALTAWLRPLLPDLSTSVDGLTTEQVEAAFSTWVARVQTGRPADGGPSAAALLMLRELMHHLGFARVLASAG